MSNKKSTAKELQEQVGQLTEALQRERADSENIRRRHDEQTSSLRTIVKANTIRDLLPVIDNFERALRHSPVESRKQKVESQDTKLDEWIKGVMSIKAQFDKTLEAMGVERIKTVGQVFDPVLHEAVAMEDASPDIQGTTEIVSEELQSGFTLDDEVIRHAMVKVRMQ